MRRFDETWHLLLEWTLGQAPSERMAALILDEEGFESIDPSHPLGGKDGGADALIQKDGEPWVMAVYFPRGQQSTKEITDKLTSDVEKAESKKPKPVGIAFVTNQELRLAEREELGKVGGDTKVELYHLERVTTVLDRPHMAGVREQFLGIPAGPPPILVTAEVIGAARSFIRDGELLDALVKMEEESLHEHNDELRSNPPNLARALPAVSVIQALGYGTSDEAAQPISDEEIAQRVVEVRRQLEDRWDACQDYLASITWPGLRFRITNLAKSFLMNVQVILTFHGAAGLEFARLEEFEWERLKDPDWEPPAYGPFKTASMLQFKPALPADYPVRWDHNGDGDLEVTITLAELRPHPPWRHTRDDVVLVLRDTALSEVTVTYTVTAHGYGTVFEGDPFTVPIEQVDIFESAQLALDASGDDG
ncbi:hypothetical protein B8W69_00425 [Mycobacterium vulneris]|uniref:Uncharacterized protein n=1 Tax=Mycolicibacterium vulneris TaxID=547163 RepID=A0A1X2LEB0_9MYCO|nr:hypothetical protein [Mycolicibacterium vulneris]OSC32296.1 hypothetical protein B8W69_00425 [Mycolicibacterium vulneris]